MQNLPLYVDVMFWKILFCMCVLFQPPRPLSESDLERVIATSKKTKVAANEYTGLSSQSPGWSRNSESGDYPVQAAISELSKLVVSQILNIQSDAQEPWIHHNWNLLSWSKFVMQSRAGTSLVIENYYTCLKFVDGVFIFLDVFQNSHFDVAIGTIFLMQLCFQFLSSLSLNF